MCTQRLSHEAEPCEPLTCEFVTMDRSARLWATSSVTKRLLITCSSTPQHSTAQFVYTRPAPTTALMPKQGALQTRPPTPAPALPSTFLPMRVPCPALLPCPFLMQSQLTPAECEPTLLLRPVPPLWPPPAGYGPAGQGVSSGVAGSKGASACRD